MKDRKEKEEEKKMIKKWSRKRKIKINISSGNFPYSENITERIAINHLNNISSKVTNEQSFKNKKSKQTSLVTR